MRFQPLLIAGLFAALALAGCLSDNDDESNGLSAAERRDFPYFHPESAGGDGNYHFEWDHNGAPFHFDWAPGNVGKMINKGDGTVAVEIPFGFIAIDFEAADQSFSLLPETFEMTAGQQIDFLAPPHAETVDIWLDGVEYFLDPTTANDFELSTTQIVSGEHVWDLSDHQRQNFPHREPGHPDGNYGKAILYFADFFEDLGMEVEVDPYGTQDQTDTTGCVNALGPTCPESLANVVATLPGNDPTAPTIFVAGGHFDMVPNTKEAAFDDTSGTVSTMELARVMSQFEWKHTLKFGLWGGEENGILGSQFWIQTNPTAKAAVTSYWNLDVVGMSWPAPLPEPDPHVIAAGLDVPEDLNGQGTGPIATELLRFAQELQADWFGFPTAVDGERMFHYEGVVSGQASGYAQVNAQSDHTPFMAAGIPSWFIFNGDTLSEGNPVGIHNFGDTLDNMTKYAYFGGDITAGLMAIEAETGEPYQWDPVEFEAAKQMLALSWESVLFFPLYSTILQDVGYWTAPGVAATAGSLDVPVGLLDDGPI